MARYTTAVATEWSAERAFDYMADLRNFEDWDPGVSSSKMVEGSEPGNGAAYDVKVGPTQLRYQTNEYSPPTRTVVEAKSRFLNSYDIISVASTNSGCTVTYDATLELNGILGFADPVLGLFFERIGNRAAAGMVKALDGRKLS